MGRRHTGDAIRSSVRGHERGPAPGIAPTSPNGMESAPFSGILPSVNGPSCERAERNPHARSDRHLIRPWLGHGGEETIEVIDPIVGRPAGQGARGRTCEAGCHRGPLFLGGFVIGDYREFMFASMDTMARAILRDFKSELEKLRPRLANAP